MKVRKFNLSISILAFLLFLSSYNLKAVNAASTYSGESIQRVDNVPSIEEYENNIQKTVLISAEELVSKTSSGQTFIVFLGFKECPACRYFSPTLKSFLVNNENVKLYYFDLDKVSKDELTPDLNNVIRNIIKLKGTPTVALIKHGKLIHEYLGSDVTEQQLNTLTKYKLSWTFYWQISK